MDEIYTIQSAADAEKDFIGDHVLSSVISIMPHANTLYHATLKGVARWIKDDSFYEKADTWADELVSFNPGKPKDPKNAKVRALRQISSWFSFLADAFEYVEDRKESLVK